MTQDVLVSQVPLSGFSEGNLKKTSHSSGVTACVSVKTVSVLLFDFVSSKKINLELLNA